MKAEFARGLRRAPWFRWLARGAALAVVAAVLTGVPSGARAAAAPVPLGTAANFAVLAGTTITNTGATTVSGNVGVSPGTAVTGFPPGQIVNGAIHGGDPAAVAAQADLAVAYNNAAAQPVTASAGPDLGGLTLTPGVYNSPGGTFGNSATLTLDAQGDPNAVFIFQAVTTLITGALSNMQLVNGARASNVFWVVGSSATLGANSTLQGNILAFTSVTVSAGAVVDGRVLARGGAVTLDTNTVTALVPELTISLTAPPGSTAPDDTVHYTITIANTGQTAYMGATVTAALTGVLDDATYDSNAAATGGTVSFTSPNLTWTGDLAVGATVTVTYSVSVDDPATGDLTLASTVSSAAPGNNCLPGSSDPQCSSSISVVLGVLSITVPPSASLGSAAPGETASGSLGIVEVTDERAGVAGWTATTSATDFTTGDGRPALTIPVADVQYLISGFTSTSGSAAFARTPETDLSGTAQTVVTATSVNGNNSAAWNPVIQLSVPGGAVAGTYSATITHSVA